MTDVKKSNFENINDLIKAIIWPLVILLFFIFYGTEIGKIIKLVPEKIESSSKISVGSLTLKIEKTAQSTGNGELAVIIKKLSEKGIRKLLTLGSGRHSLMVRSKLNEDGVKQDAYSIPEDIDVFEELEKNGLLISDEPISGFIKFVRKLDPIEKIHYKNSHGSWSDEQRDSFTIKYVEYILPFQKLSAEENIRLDSFGVELSETGKKAFEIVVHVIAEQISNG